MEIKFRVWNGSAYEYDVMVGKFGAFYVNPMNNGLDATDSASLSPFNTKFSDSVAIEQFTGEKCYVTHSDLYVGDIMERNLELFVIEFKHGSFVCRSVDKPHKSYSLSIFTSVTSVGNAGAKIGNIHNNAELLEAESGSCY